MEAEREVIKQYWYYNTTNLKFEGFQVNGKLQGECKTYHFHGKLKTICNYVDGQINGEYRSYYYNGNLESICNYNNGILQGIYKTYAESGELWTECNYVSDKREGEFKSYYKNGRVSMICTYLNGELERECRKFYDNGGLRELSNYKNGKRNGICKTYIVSHNADEPHIISGEYNYVNDKKEGEARRYYNTGEVECVSNFKDDLLHGETTYFYKNGQIRAIYKCKNGIQTYDPYITFDSDGNKISFTGPVKIYYDDNKQLKAEYSMVNGVKEGPYKSYHSNGQLHMLCNYVNGELEGELREYYFENGEICEIRNYKNGEYDGIYKTYYLYYNANAPLNKIKSECTYVNGKKESETIWYENNGHITKSHKYMDDIKQ